MRTLFCACLCVFSTVFVYSNSAVAQTNDYYTQLRKTKDLTPEKDTAIRKKTADQNRIHEVNSMSAKIAEENRSEEKKAKGDASDDDNTAVKLPAAKTTHPTRSSPAANIAPPAGDTPPLKVNKEDFPDDIDFSSEKPAVQASPKKK